MNKKIQQETQSMDIDQKLDSLGIEEVSPEHPIYKEPPFVIFTSPSGKPTKLSLKNKAQNPKT